MQSIKIGVVCVASATAMLSGVAYAQKDANSPELTSERRIAMLSSAPYARKAAAGRVLFVIGEVQLIAPDGSVRALSRGDAVNEGDTVSTAAGSQAQLRMADNALIAVRPDSRMLFEAYRFAGREDSSDSAVIALTKGGMRSITGAIGLTNKENYRLKIDTAWIGIRGTDHEAFYVPAPQAGDLVPGEPGVYDRVNVGGTFIEASGRRIDVSPNETGFVALDVSAVPVKLDQMPSFMRFASIPQGHDDRQAMRSATPSDQQRIQASQRASEVHTIIEQRRLGVLPAETAAPVLPSEALGGNSGGRGFGPGGHFAPGGLHLPPGHGGTPPGLGGGTPPGLGGGTPPGLGGGTPPGLGGGTPPGLGGGTPPGLGGGTPPGLGGGTPPGLGGGTPPGRPG